MNAEVKDEMKGWPRNVLIRKDGEGIGHGLFLYYPESGLEEPMKNTRSLSLGRRSRGGI
jgi:hypothetical protein